MPYLGNVLTSFNVGTNNINNDAVTTEKIADGAIINADVNASAAIAGTKINPNFGSQTVVTTGIFSAAGGAAATPSIAFTGDLNTGIYSPGADQVAISTNGTGRLFVDSSGRLGVGTSAPQARLEIAQSADNTDGPKLRIANNGNTLSSGQLIGGIDFFDGDDSAEGIGAYIYSYTTDSIGRASGQDLRFGTGESEKMRLDSSGRLGLGSSSPSYKLTVSNTGGSNAGITLLGNDQANARIRIDNGGSGGRNWELTAGLTGANNSYFSIYDQTASASRFVISDTGAVGIGTTSPGTRLHVSGTQGDNSTLYITSTDLGANNGGIISIGGAYDGSGNTTAFTQIKALKDNATSGEYGGSLAFFNRAGTSGLTEKARIDSSGRLLVGTSSSQATNNGSDTGYSPQNQFVVTGYEGVASFTNWTNSVGMNNNGGTILFINRCTSNSSGTHTGGALVNGDKVGRIVFNASDGTAFRTVANIEVAMDGTTGSSDVPGRLVFSTTADGASSPTQRFLISNGGFINCPGFYSRTTATAANMLVDAGGDVYRSTSSAKYKTDIETIQDSYADALLQCRPVWYRSTCPDDNPNWGWWGFIAEEVAAIDPRLVHWKTVEVTYDDKGAAVQTPCDPEPEGVQYDRFVPHLLNLIKRQGEAIAELQAEVATLKAS